MDIQSIKYIKCKLYWNPNPLKWILNGLNQSKSELDKKHQAFCSPCFSQNNVEKDQDSEIQYFSYRSQFLVPVI